jgi:hypothetical protein
MLVTFPSGTLFNCTKQKPIIPDHVTAQKIQLFTHLLILYRSLESKVSISSTFEILTLTIHPAP